MNLYQAANQFDVPYPLLYRHYKKNTYKNEEDEEYTPRTSRRIKKQVRYSEEQYVSSPQESGDEKGEGAA